MYVGSMYLMSASFQASLNLPAQGGVDAGRAVAGVSAQRLLSGAVGGACAPHRRVPCPAQCSAAPLALVTCPAGGLHWSRQTKHQATQPRLNSRLSHAPTSLSLGRPSLFTSGVGGSGIRSCDGWMAPGEEGRRGRTVSYAATNPAPSTDVWRERGCLLFLHCLQGRGWGGRRGKRGCKGQGGAVLWEERGRQRACSSIRPGGEQQAWKGRTAHPPGGPSSGTAARDGRLSGRRAER